MANRLSKSYVDRLFSEKNLGEIYWAIGVVGNERPLPEAFWLFARIYEWAPSRSGVWQYYEGLSNEQYQRVHDDLIRFGLAEIAARYRLGRDSCDDPTQATEVDRWLDRNAEEIHNTVFELIVEQKDCLTSES